MWMLSLNSSYEWTRDKGLALEWLGLACLLPMRGQLNCRSSCSIISGPTVLRLYSDCLDCYEIGWIVWAEKTISLRVTVVSGPIPTTMNAFAPCLGALYPTFCFCQLFGTTSIGERWFRSTLLAWFYGFTIAQVVWFSYCYSALIAFDFSAEVGCHLNACLRRGVRSDSQLSCTETRFQKCC